MTRASDTILLALLCLLNAVFCEASNNERLPMTTLETGQKFPMVGLEVDGLRGEEIPPRISDAMQNTTQYGFFNTAQRNNNERRVNIGIVNAVVSSDLYSSQIHVITKVPYTHLGYERTRLSVKQSLQEIQNRNTHVHVLLEWPRCRDDVSWMHCEEDEMRLPQHVKAAGPPPHFNKEFAYIESWQALEELYLREDSLGPGLPSIASIGVANFDKEDLQQLELHSRVLPHILQRNVWAYVYDPFLVDYCNLNLIHFQTPDVLSEVFGKQGINPPRALGSLHGVAQTLLGIDGRTYTAKQVVLKWLVQSGVSVSSLATNTADVHEFSAVSIASMPNLTRKQLEMVESAVSAMLIGEDLPPPMARFHNRLRDGILHLFWYNEDTGEEVPVENVSPGSTYISTTYTGHKFVAYADESRSQRREMVVERSYGQSQRFLIDEL